MKYIVMECHPAYSILMDEESRFVRAANMRYEPGQIVEDPILMTASEDKKPKITVSHNIVKWVSVAAACLVLFLGFGYFYRSGHSVYSTITVSAAEAEIDLELDSDGKVISMRGKNDLGKEFMKNYNFNKGCDRVTAERELVEKLTEMGYVKSGDTLNFYIDTPETKTFDDYSNELMNIVDCMQTDKLCFRTQIHHNNHHGGNTPPAPVKTSANTTAITAAVPSPATNTVQTTFPTITSAPAYTNGNNGSGYQGGHNDHYVQTRPAVPENRPPQITDAAPGHEYIHTAPPEVTAPGNPFGDHQFPDIPDGNIEENIIPGNNNHHPENDIGYGPGNGIPGDHRHNNDHNYDNNYQPPQSGQDKPADPQVPSDDKVFPDDRYHHGGHDHGYGYYSIESNEDAAPNESGQDIELDLEQ